MTEDDLRGDDGGLFVGVDHLICNYKLDPLNLKVDIEIQAIAGQQVGRLELNLAPTDGGAMPLQGTRRIQLTDGAKLGRNLNMKVIEA